MQIADEVQEKLTEGLNAEGRGIGHVALGVVVCAGLIALTAGLAATRAQPPAPGAEPTRDPVKRAIWPSLFSVATLAALRVWNAPSSPARSRALGLWGVLQGANLAFTLWRPRARGAQVAVALTTAGLTAIYARSAAQVDQKAATLTAPTGFAGLASIVATPGH